MSNLPWPVYAGAKCIVLVLNTGISCHQVFVEAPSDHNVCCIVICDYLFLVCPTEDRVIGAVAPVYVCVADVTTSSYTNICMN